MNRFAIFLIAGLIAVPALAAKPQIQWNPEYPFDSVQTFKWDSSSPSPLATEDPFMHSRIVTAIEYELASSGLTAVDDNPDIYVTYHTSTTSRVRLDSTSYGYGFGGYGGGRWGYYGYGMGGPIQTTTRVSEYDEGTLVVDIWDAKSRELVWRGSVTAVLSENPTKAENQVVKSIQQMAKQGRKLWAKAQRGN